MNSNLKTNGNPASEFRFRLIRIAETVFEEIFFAFSDQEAENTYEYLKKDLDQRINKIKKRRENASTVRNDG